MNPYIYVFVTAFLWALLAPGLKAANAHLDSLTIVWLRFLIAFLGLVVITLIRSPEKIKVLARPPKMFIASALFLAFNYFGYMKGVELTTPSNAQIIVQFGPLALVLYGVFLFKEKLSVSQKGGFLFVVLGFLIFYNDQFSNLVQKGNDSYTAGVVWVFFSALSWATYAAMQKVLAGRLSTSEANLIIYAIPVLIFVPFVDPRPLLAGDYKLWSIVIFLGLNTLIAYSSLTEALRRLPANKVGVWITLNPLVTIALLSVLNSYGITRFGVESIGHDGLLGACVLIFGAIMVSFKKGKKR